MLIFSLFNLHSFPFYFTSLESNIISSFFFYTSCVCVFYFLKIIQDLPTWIGISNTKTLLASSKNCETRTVLRVYFTPELNTGAFLGENTFLYVQAIQVFVSDKLKLRISSVFLIFWFVKSRILKSDDEKSNALIEVLLSFLSYIIELLIKESKPFSGHSVAFFLTFRC
jgi:hypothetical protein